MYIINIPPFGGPCKRAFYSRSSHYMNMLVSHHGIHVGETEETWMWMACFTKLDGVEEVGIGVVGIHEPA